MKYLDEFRDPILARSLLAAIARTTTRPWVIMEVCGGQTHAIMRHGIDQLLPPAISLIHGPGCPVCVTPLEILDRGLALAALPGLTLTTFGDMLRVPGSREDLMSMRSRGADVRVVDSPLAALQLARAMPDREVVFLAVGFETTTPASALVVKQAAAEGLTNFSLLCAHVLVPPAMAAIMAEPDNRVQGFLAAGHVCTITGWALYEELSEQYQVPIVPTGFEPVDILDGILHVIQRLEGDDPGVENRYQRVVKRDGNIVARTVVEDVFTVCDRPWRGIGTIVASGLRLRDRWGAFDAERKFDVGGIRPEESTQCLSGEILQGRRCPLDCPAFGVECTPANPLGATMVSSEGACAAYWEHARPRGKEGAR